MSKKWIVSALGVAAMFVAAPVANAQKASGAEISLIGIKLYDSGLRVVSMYGTPDQVQAVSGGGGGIGPGGGGPGGPGGMPAGAPGSGRGGGGAAPMAPSMWHNDSNPFAFSNNFLQKGGMEGSLDAPSGPPGQGGQGFGPGGAPAGAPGGGGAAAGGGNSGRIVFTRWVYNRSGSKYGFVLDKSNRVVQIEAIGLSNARVKTARGIGFGSTFAQVIRKYQTPDGYEINGDNVVVRFLRKNKVAFKLSRLGANKPQVVTGIVVAAGKS